MSPTLQRMMSDLKLLSLEERWRLLSHLVDQLRLGATAAPQENAQPSAHPNAADIDRLLLNTQGCWGYKGIEEIDANLSQQRQRDWQSNLSQ